MAPVRAQTAVSIAIAILLALALILVSVAVANTVAQPIQKLAAAAQTVEQEEPFEPEAIADVTARGDEVGRLARVFSDMAIAVQERARKLKAEVQQLRIEIDQSKRERQVKEIVEEDFFQDLQARAREMRRQRQNPTGEDVT
jgi:nitrogen fixation/metabolism regulation signal transduction histidine kinase